MNDLLIYPFSLREPTYTIEILDPIIKDTLLYLLFVQPYTMCSPNSKGQIKDIKNGRDGPKVMVYPKMLWDKRKEVVTYKRLVPKSKGISELERFIRP